MEREAFTLWRGPSTSGALIGSALAKTCSEDGGVCMAVSPALPNQILWATQCRSGYRDALPSHLVACFGTSWGPHGVGKPAEMWRTQWKVISVAAPLAQAEVLMLVKDVERYCCFTPSFTECSGLEGTSVGHLVQPIPAWKQGPKASYPSAASPRDAAGGNLLIFFFFFHQSGADFVTSPGSSPSSLSWPAPG